LPELDLDGRDVVSRAGADWGELWEVFKVDNVSDEPLNELGLTLLESDRGSLELSLVCNFDESLCIAIELAFTETIVLSSGELLVETTADSVKGTLVVGVARECGLSFDEMETTVSFFG
jgi:hypothetical protein